MAKPRITTDESLTALLFEKLDMDKHDKGVELFHGSSIDTSVSATPWAKEHMLSDEWDEKDKLSITLILSENFRGRMSVTSAGPGGADCFCGKLKCVTVTNFKYQVKFPSNHFFIQDGPQSADIFLSSPRPPLSWTRIDRKSYPGPR